MGAVVQTAPLKEKRITPFKLNFFVNVLADRYESEYYIVKGNKRGIKND